MNRSTLKYLALLPLVVVLFYWKTLLTSQFTLIIGSEGVDMTYSWLHFWVQSVWRGHIPLWDPYTFAGSPFAAAMLPSAYFPLHLLFALAPMNRQGLISPSFYHQYMALTHLLCAYFTFALLRELNRSRLASFTGACAFSLGGLLGRIFWPPYVECCIWLPAIFLFLLRALRVLQQNRARALIEASLAGLCLAMSILTGGMAFVFMQAIFAVTAVWYYGARAPLARIPGERPRWIGIGLILAVTMAVAGGLAAVQLLPANEYSKLSMRFIDGGAFPSSQKIPYDRLVPGMWPQSIVTALFPAGFDGKIAGEEAYPFYIGVFPLFLAITGVWKCWENLWVRYLTGLSVLAFIYSLGELSPLHGVLYAIVPLLWVTRSADRFFYLISFALAILSAFGLDALLDPSNQDVSWLPARRILKWVAIIAAAALLLPGLFVQLNLSLWNAFSLLIILGSCGLFVRLTTRPATPALRATLVLFSLFDLSTFNWVEVNKSVFRKTVDELDQMVSLRGAAKFIKARPGLNRVRVTVEPQPNVGDSFGIESVWGGGATTLTAYSQLGLRDELLNVRYRISPAKAVEPDPIYKDAHWKVYDNRNAYPRGWVVHQTVLAPSHEAAIRQLDEFGTKLRQIALIERPLPQRLDPAAGTDETVHFRSYEAERMAMDVNAAGAGLLVLSEIYYPGWVATVNGKPAEIHQVDSSLRGIVVANGANRVELQYSPASFRVGAAISILTLICVASGFLYARRVASLP